MGIRTWLYDEVPKNSLEQIEDIKSGGMIMVEALACGPKDCMSAGSAAPPATPQRMPQAARMPPYYYPLRRLTLFIRPPYNGFTAGG